MDALAVPRIHGEGTAEELWALDPVLAALPTRDPEELVPRGARAVVIAPHPDDEVLATGGLMSLLAESHRDILVIAVTEGEASHDTIPAAEVAHLRRGERTVALRRLGLADAPVCSLYLPDGELRRDVDGLARRLLEHLRADDVVFHPWEGDGHPDHEATGLAAIEAIRSARAVGHAVPIWAWHWCEPRLANLPFGQASKLPLPARTLAAKKAAIAAFASQLEWQADRGPILTARTLAYFLRPFEVILT